MSQQILLSVIVPTCGRTELLERCLGALSNTFQTIDSESYEVIVSDDQYSETNRNHIVSLYPDVIYLQGPVRGPAANRNNGAQHAHGTHLVFTDDDCIPDSTWLAAYREIIQEHPTCKVFEGRVFADRPQATFDEISPINERGGFLWSCNLAIERNFFIKLGGFDERFPYAAMEDVELRKRIYDAGERAVFTEHAAVCHPWRKKKGWKEFKNHQYSTKLYLSLHPTARAEINCLSYLHAVVYGLVKFVIPRLLRGKTSGLAVQLLEYASFLQMALFLAFDKGRINRHDSSYRS